MTDFIPELLKNSVTLFFGILQVALIAAVGGLFKLYSDMIGIKKDMNQAFGRIRRIENQLDKE